MASGHTLAVACRRSPSSLGTYLKDWHTVFKDIEPFCDDFKPRGFITEDEDIAVLLSSNGDMVYDLKMTVSQATGL